jgi:SNF2 family DNA or RNA helicase
VYYSNDYSLEVRMQSEDRAHRIGQEQKVTYIDLIAEGTIDERIVKALNSKIDLASQVMGEDPKKILFG